MYTTCQQETLHICKLKYTLHSSIVNQQPTKLVPFMRVCTAHVANCSLTIYQRIFLAL